MIQSVIATVAIVGFLLVLALAMGALALLDNHCNKSRVAH